MLPPNLGRKRAMLSAISLPRPVFLGSALALIIAAIVMILLATLASAQPAAAQTSIELVGNDGQTFTHANAGTYQHNYATSFTTGGSPEGYVLTRTDVWNRRTGTPTLSNAINLAVYTDDSGVPGTLLGSGSAIGINDNYQRVQISIYDNPLGTGSPGINLDPNTKYWVVAAPNTGAGSGHPSQLFIAGTSSDAEDSDAYAGWTIGNHRLFQAKAAGSSWSASNTSANALRMSLVGYANDSPAPVVRTARVSGDGTKVTLYYGEPLDSASVPGTARFAVKVAANDTTPTAVTIAGSAVTLALATAATVSTGEAVAVTYDASSAPSPIRDHARANAASIHGLPATNDRGTVPTVSSTAFTSTPTHDTDTTPDGVNDTYGVGTQIKVRVTFSEKVTVDMSLGTPRLKIKLHADHGERWAEYESGSGTTILTFAYAIANADSSSDGTTDAGARVLANSLELNGGRIRSMSSSRDASLAHAVLGPSSTQKVNGALDAQPPRFILAQIPNDNSTFLQIVVDDAVDSTSVPAGSSFCVTATAPSGSTRRICGNSSNVALSTVLSRQFVTATLNEAIRIDDVVTYDYTKPSSNFLKDANGNAVPSFSDRPVLNGLLQPPTPTGLTVTAATGSASLDVSWTAPTGGATPTGYDLRYYAGAADPPAGREADWTDDAPGLPDPGTSTSETIKGLKENTAYRVQVRSTTHDKGDWSDSVTATTAAAPATNNAPRRLGLQTADAQGNICYVVNNPLNHTGHNDAVTNTLHSRFPLVSRDTETTDLPSSCKGTGPVQPVFDDKDGDTLTVTAEVRDLPDNVRLAPTYPFITQPTTGKTGRLWFRGTAAFKNTMVWVYVTATDSHGASVTSRHGFDLASLVNASAPSLTATADQTASTSREFSLVLPAPTGGDLGGGDGQVFPYFYRLTGLPKGLVFDSTTRTISGTPLETGTFTVTYTVDDADDHGSSYLNPGNTDETTNVADIASDSFTITVASTPHIDIVRVVSAPTHDANGDGKNDTYGAGDKIVVDVEYTLPVNVDIPVGVSNGVRIRLDLGPDDDTLSNSRKTADLTGVHHGGKTLRFEYTVVAADNDPDGVWVQTHETTGQLLFVRGTATITGLATGTAADLNASGMATEWAVSTDGIPTTYVNGRLSAAGPQPASATVNGTTLSVTFDQDLATLSAADLNELVYHFGVQGVDSTGGNRNAWHHPSQVATTSDAKVLQITLGVAARVGDVVTLSYKLDDHEGPIKDSDGNSVPAFIDFEVTNNTGGTAAPRPLKATVSGTTLEIIFNATLKTSSTVPANAFTVLASNRDYNSRTIAGTGNATVSGTKVTVTLDATLQPDELAQVSYDSSTGGLQSNAQSNPSVLSFNGFRVETVKDTTAPDLVGGAAVQMRAVPAQSQVVLYFDEPLHPNGVPATGDFTVKVDLQTAVNPSAVAVEDNAVTLTIDNALVGGTTLLHVVYTVPDDSNAANRIRDIVGNEAAAFDSTSKLTGGLVASAAGTPLPVISNLPGQATTLVSNTGQPANESSDLGFDFSQAFTTGSLSIGYRLTSVMIPYSSQTPSSSSHGVSIHASNSGRPGASLATLSYGSVSGNSVTYTASGTGIYLDPATQYVVVLDSSVDLSQVKVPRTSSNSEDAGASTGWALADGSLIREFGATSWTTSSTSLGIAIHGYARSFDLKVNGARLTLTYDKPLDPTSVPEPDRFTLLQDAGADESVEYGRVASVAIHGKKLVLTMDGPVLPCDGEAPFTLSYSRSTTGKNLRTLTGHDAADIVAQKVTNSGAAPCKDGNVVVQGPSGNSGGGHGKSLRIHFEQPLDTGKALKASAFALAPTSGEPPPAVEGAAYTSDGATVVLTLVRTLENDEKVTLSYTRPLRHPGLWTATGSQIADFSGVEVPVRTPRTKVTNITVVSNAPDDHTYRLGDVLQIRVTFEGPVEVEGTPLLKIDMDPAHWGEKWATYDSGSGAASLIFTHEVVEPNISTQGIAVLANTLQTNGGSIRSAATQAEADLAHTGLNHDPAHKVDWRPEAVTVTGITVVSNAGDDHTYRLGDVIQVRVTFDEAVDVEGTPLLKIDMDPAHWGEKWATYDGGSGSASLFFTHEVVEPNFSTQGIAVLANTLQTNGGSIRSAATDARVDLEHEGLNHDPAHKVDWR